MKRFFSFPVFSAVWAVGFFCALLPLRSIDAHFFLAAFIILALGVVARFFLLPQDAALKIPKSPFLLFFVAFWAVALNSSIFSEVPFISFIFFSFISLLPLSFLFSAVQRDHEVYFAAIYKLACVYFAILSVLTIVQYFFFPSLLYNGLTHLPLANPNSLGGLLSLGFFGAYGLMVGGRTKLMNNLGLALAALIFMALLTTGSRGATLALIGGLTMFAFFSFSTFKRHLRCHGALVGIAVLAFCIVSFVQIYPNGQTALDVVSQTVSGNMPVLQDRPYIWQALWRIAMDHFWNGIGIGTLFLYYPEYRTKDYYTAGLMGHNDPLQFFAEMGIFAPLLFYALAGFAIYKTLRCWAILKSDKDEAQRLRILIPFCAMGALIAHTHISFHFYIVPNLFLMGTLLAYWFIQVERVLPSESWVITQGDAKENTIVKACVIALLTCQLIVFVPSQLSELMVRYAKARIQKHGDLERFIKWNNRARRISFYRNGRADALASTVPSGILRARDEFEPGERERLFYRAKALLDRSIVTNNRQASFYYELSILSEYAQEHFPEEAKKMRTPLDLMRTAVRLDPLHANTRLRLANLLIENGQKDEAFEVLKGGLYWHYAGQKTRAYWHKTALLSLEFSDSEVRDIALRKLRFAR